MGAAGKPPPLVCFKWPWGPNPIPSASSSPSPCGDLELPWLFKSIRTLAQGLLIAGDIPSPASSPSGGVRGVQRRTGAAVVEVDRGDAEQRALAASLASGRPATVLEFYSPRCRLCASLQGLVRELQDGASGSASFVLADAEDDRWLPEVIYKQECLQSLTKRKIDPPIAAITQLKHYLMDLQVRSIFFFVGGCKHSGLHLVCTKFFSHENTQAFVLILGHCEDCHLSI
uniref:Thioredoxin domain-containing protein n=1 Tax=Zea mays TaxID=4577 RepID=A0A804NKL8_MAIZE